MTASLDEWWLRMFRALLDREMNGEASPAALAKRWLVLDLHALATRRRPHWVLGFELPDYILHFLDDADIRSKDAGYAQNQWAQARE